MALSRANVRLPAGQPLGKLFAIAIVLGLFSTGILMMLVPEEVGGDGDDGSDETEGIWQRMDDEPSERDEFAMVYDSNNNVIVLFGGAGVSDEKYGDTWLFDLSLNIWTQKNSSSAPTPRFGHAMAFDSTNNIIILFGGTDEQGQQQDTWVYDVKTDTWTERFPNKSPSMRRCHAMVYDSADAKIVLFGGLNGTEQLDDSWVYDVASNAWIQKDPVDKPSARYMHRMVYDPFSDYIVLFGGYDGNNNDETWLYDLDLDTWTQTDSDQEPSARYGQGMVHDLSANKVVLFGGYDGNNDDETWLYDVDSKEWTNVNPDQNPPARHYLGMVYDSANEKTVLFGGNNLDKLGDTWLYDYETNNWTQQGQVANPSARDAFGMAYDSDNDKIVLFGGNDGSRNNETWIYDIFSNTWTQKFPSISPSARVVLDMVYDSMNKKVVLFGGQDDSGNLQDTWVYDVISNYWEEKNPSTKPPIRRAHAMAFDSTTNVVVLFGGFNEGDGGRDDTWTYDVADDSWEKKNPLTTPPDIHYHNMIYDPINKNVVLFGGMMSGNNLNDNVWVYDVSSDNWEQMNPSQKPPGRELNSMAYNFDTGEIVIFGGNDRSKPYGDTWAYNLSANNWTLMDPSQSPSVRWSHRMVYDPVNKRMILFGGTNDSGFKDDTWTYSFATSQPKSSLTLTTSAPTYRPSNLVTINATYTGGPCNITYYVKDANEDAHLMETVMTEDWQIPMNGLVAYWPFEEGEGEMVYDMSGYGHDGTIYGGGDWTEGIQGYGRIFDGQDDYILTSSSDLLVGDDPDEWSYMAWFKTDISGKEMYILTDYESSALDQDYAMLIFYGNAAQIGTQIRTSGDTTGIGTDESYSDNTWHQAAIVVSKKEDYIHLYLDGVRKKVDNLSDTDADYFDGGNITFGSCFWNNQYRDFFSGVIDEPRIYDRALSEDEISTIYNNYLNPVQTAKLTFKVDDDDPIGTYTVYATNDKDNATANITFEVLAPPPPPTITLSIDFPTEVKLGDTLHVDFTVTNGFDSSYDILLGLQLKDPSQHALRPDIKEKNIDAIDQKMWQLSVKISKDAETGEYFLQGQMLNDWPDKGGYVLDYETDRVTVTAG